ncbi:DUF5672 family protein [Croceicoccus marinus]|uniref:DUF5672 domain-containing protein n=1 Tax=Croceicoccus marinus TaxID=450378 RepID=A0A1Z1FDA8_9SPHN|nr:DUF5672 family protein [Croceicoccus marinus]ARU16706.1 hypothetical protein A9D14_11595 [Croceicoccus marinus]
MDDSNPTIAGDRRLSLPQVTLCAASSVNLAATIRALEACMAQIDFAQVLLFTDSASIAKAPPVPAPIKLVHVAPMLSSAAYSSFILKGLADHVVSSHCLVVQWDGHVIDAGRWSAEFLDYDYVGASWPQFGDGHDVGNGGFSLRSRRLLEACRSPDFAAHHPEDLAIGRTNRPLLEAKGMRFAPREVADRFAAERAGDPDRSFGYHGVFLMPRVLGAEGFWTAYASLDERSSLKPDFADLLRAVFGGARGARRALAMIGRRLGDATIGRRFRRVNKPGKNRESLCIPSGNGD